MLFRSEASNKPTVGCLHLPELPGFGHAGAERRPRLGDGIQQDSPVCHAECLEVAAQALEVLGRDHSSRIATLVTDCVTASEAAARGDDVNLPAFYPNNTYFDPKIVLRKREQR